MKFIEISQLKAGQCKIIENMKKLVKEQLNEISSRNHKITVKELILKLQQFDQELPVGGEGYYGEYLELEDVRLSFANNRSKFVVIELEDKGEEPD